MGLGLYVGGSRYAGWSYSGFNRFRERIAKSIGINLHKMEGFSEVEWDKNTPWEIYIKAVEADRKAGKISWDTVTDPIKSLLCHSDCDGEIPAEECAAIADRLEEIIKDWDETFSVQIEENWQKQGYPPSMCLPDYDVQESRGLITGMREAAKTGNPLKFC